MPTPLTITVLGSGTSVPDPHRRPPAFLLRSGELSLLIDCGAGCTTGLARAGVTLDALTAVLITHLHLDHTGGVPALLFSMRNPLGPPRRDDLVFYGPEALSKQLDGLSQAYGKWIDPLHCQRRCEPVASGQSFSVGEATIEPFSVKHLRGAFAYRVCVGGTIVTFSGDSGPCSGLIDAARGADLFVCECGATDEEKSWMHLGPTAAAATAAEAGCQALLLTHLYPHVVATDPLSRARARFDGPVTLAEDDLEIRV